MSKRFQKSVRKFLRKEKARIRAEFLDARIREEKIQELLEKVRKYFQSPASLLS